MATRQPTAEERLLAEQSVRSARLEYKSQVGVYVQKWMDILNKLPKGIPISREDTLKAMNLTSTPATSEERRITLLWRERTPHPFDGAYRFLMEDKVISSGVLQGKWHVRLGGNGRIWYPDCHHQRMSFTLCFFCLGKTRDFGFDTAWAAGERAYYNTGSSGTGTVIN